MTSIEERYMRATVSSHLEAKAHEPGDIDVLIASAWSRDEVGALLLRLRTEYDRSMPMVAAMLGMRSLERTKQAVYRMAVAEATRQKFMVPDKALAPIVARVLAYWLDPTCHHCEGRGFTGGSHRGEARIYCRHCRGVGVRLDWAGHRFEEQRFSSHLLGELHRHLLEASRSMRRSLREET